MNTVKDLREELLVLFGELKSGVADVKVAAEMNNTTGKVINSVKLELEYATLRKEKPNISFLETSKRDKC